MADLHVKSGQAAERLVEDGHLALRLAHVLDPRRDDRHVRGIIQDDRAIVLEEPKKERAFGAIELRRHYVIRRESILFSE